MNTIIQETSQDVLLTYYCIGMSMKQMKKP